jgi:hypothetical protein
MTEKFENTKGVINIVDQEPPTPLVHVGIHMVLVGFVLLDL